MEVDVSFAFAIVTAAISAGGAFAVARWRVQSTETELKELRLHFTQHQHEFNQFQIEAAEKYVTATALSKMEAELKGSLDRLTNRLDVFLQPNHRPPRRT
jgi:predicted lipid-binding transport protein (Tim44 family)